MKNISHLIPYIIIVTLAILLFKQCEREPEIKEIEITKWIKVPVQVKDFDTIPYPVPTPGKTIIDSTYYEEYVKLKDSITKDSLIRDAFTIREYNNVFEDTIQTINAYSKVRGNLLENSVSYKTKPFKIRYDTIIKYEVNPRKTVLSVGGTIMVPTEPGDINVTIYPEFDLRIKNRVYSGGYDFVNKRVIIGGKIDLW